MHLNKLLYGILTIYVFSVWYANGIKKDHTIIFSFLDVGQGDSILISLASGEKVLIDGGPNDEADRLLRKKYWFNNCELEALIITHPHADHYVGAARIIEHCKVRNIFVTERAYEMKDKILPDLDEETKLMCLTASSKFIIGQVHFYVLWPKEEFVKYQTNLNNHSIVVLVDYGSYEALFMGDLESDVFNDISWDEYLHLIDDGLDLLKVSHHGSKTGTTFGLLNLLNPSKCVISVGRKNSFGHPHEEVINLLLAQNCEILRTDVQGTIEISTF